MFLWTVMGEIGDFFQITWDEGINGSIDEISLAMHC